MGYVLPTPCLASILSLCRGVLGGVTSAQDDREMASEVLSFLRHIDGLDSAKLREVAEWARDRAKARDEHASIVAKDSEGREADTVAHARRIMADSARIIELSKDILLALAESRLPEGAVTVIGREPAPPEFEDRVQQAVHESRGELRKAAMREPLRFVPIAEVEPEHAANTPNLAGLPPIEWVVLGDMLARLEGRPETHKPSPDLKAGDVQVALDSFLRRLANSLGTEPTIEAPALADAAWQAVYDRNKWKSAAEDAARHAAGNFDALEKAQANWRVFIGDVSEALGLNRDAQPGEVLGAAHLADHVAETGPSFTLPDSHPLRSYRWGDFIRYLMRIEELGASSGHLVGDRLDGLRAILTRTDALDVDGLRGVLLWAVLDKDVEALLEFAAGDVDVDVHANAESARRGRFVVPAVERERGGK